MKLKKLEISGFKSFNEKTAISFPPGISAIVGPNGCGKSNVIDAIRWVMGEQSAKQLRGKSMEDVIFSGTNGHAPVNMAEVSLTLLNDNGSAPEELKDFTEIMLTRRVYRSGERVYFINKQPCRLKDIYNIFYGSGMGPKSFAVIQQGNIGAITDAGTDERRYFIEEAAGTTRYKNRKTEALRKVESTNQNLLRLNDILSEIKRQMAGLKRQAKKAERFKTFQDRIRTLDALLSIAEFDRLTVKIEEADDLLKGLKDEDVGFSTRLKKIDAAVEEIKFQKEKKNQVITAQKTELFEKQRTIDKTENDLAHQKETVERLTGEIDGLASVQQDLESKSADIVAEIDQVQGQNAQFQEERRSVRSDLETESKAAQTIGIRLASLEEKKETGKAKLYDLVAQEAQYKNIFQNAANNKDNVKRRLKRASEEEVLANRQITYLSENETKVGKALEDARFRLEDLRGRISRTKMALDDKSKMLGEQIKRVQTLEIEKNKVRSRYTTLKKMEDNYEWYRDGVKAIMKPRQAGDRDTAVPDPSTVLGLMADILEPEPSYEMAVDAVLGESLQYILVKDQQTGAASIEYLQGQGAGRSGFIPVSSVKPVDLGRGKTPQSPGRLLDKVRVSPGFENIAESLMGHVIVAADITQALEIFNRNGVMQTIVTRTGDVISHQGVMIGGSTDKLSGILAKKKEIKDLERALAHLTGELDTARHSQKEMESGLRDIEKQLQKSIEEKNRASQEEIDTEKALFKATEELKHARRHLDITSLEKEQLQGEASDLEEEMVKYNQAVADIVQKIEDLQKEVSETSEQIRQISARMEGLNQKVVDLKLQETTVNARLENSNNTLRRLEEYKNDTRDRFRQLTRDITIKTEKIDTTRQKIRNDEDRLAGLYEGIQTLEKSLGINQDDFMTIDARLRENDASISEIQNKREVLLQKIRLLELDRSEKRLKRENVESRVGEQYQATIPEFRVEFRQQLRDVTTDTDMPVHELEDELTQIRTRISKITDVNLGAIKEFDQLEERFDFLTKQRDDLINAVDDLHQVIRKIDKITQEQFIKTFNQINEKLTVVFPRLFEGGTAKLVLTEPDRPLETGVEFMIHPPGKKLTRLSLLSGGEKALSAIAFIFSIFLIKPASFCLLDEIDAPLDDANVFRFNNLLQLIGENSQVVMITHNKRSMEFADTLFGITMEKKGISKVVSVDLVHQSRN